MPLYLGIDSSTQSLTAILLDIDGDRRRVAFESSLAFDDAFPRYGTRHGVLPALERFTGPQIRKFFKTDPVAYRATDRVHLISSFLASLLIGGHAPVDPGDASGTNLMDLSTARWWPAALEATAPHLAMKLPPIAPSWSVVGRLSRFWQQRYRLPAAKVIAWSGDNPCSLIGTGLVRDGAAGISLGTSDTIFGLMRDPSVDRTGTGHVFAAPTGAFMGLTCF